MSEHGDKTVMTYTFADGSEGEGESTRCKACGHFHCPAFGDICIGCPCEETPNTPKPEPTP
jgi:uncharacterized OB-fold protein